MPRPSKPQPPRRLPAQARLAAILDRLEKDGALSVSEIAADFDISEMTVRRDLDELEEAGHLTRVHGGAVPAAATPRDALPGLPPDPIAAEAARLVAPCHSIAMDGALLTQRTARILAQRLAPGRTRIFTHSLTVAEPLAATGAEVYLPPGRLGSAERTLTGPAAVAHYAGLYVDVAVLGIAGLTGDGVFDSSIEEAAVKQALIGQADRRIGLCEAQAFGRRSLVRLCELAGLTTLITDAAPPPDLAQALRSAGVAVRVAAR
ncbi:DeoR/GlpR family DNA-binding transcription regulator [Pseudooceanicola sp. 502str34]